MVIARTIAVHCAGRFYCQGHYHWHSIAMCRTKREANKMIRSIDDSENPSRQREQQRTEVDNENDENRDDLSQRGLRSTEAAN